MRPRYFLSYYDDTLTGVYNHRSGELAGRRAVIISFLNRPPKPQNGRIGASVRMGKGLLGKLGKLGIK